MAYGFGFTADEIKQNILESNKDYRGYKTWEGLYASNSLAEQQDISELQQNLSANLNEAYASSLRNMQAIQKSNIGQGYKDEAMLQNEEALAEAFEAYQKNYMSDVSKVQQTYDKNQLAITENLYEQAEYAKQLAEKPYEYLEYMYDEYRNTDLFKDPLWSRYLTQDDQGKERLRTFDELIRGEMLASEDGVQESTALFDESGALTLRGQEFYDQMMNQFAQGNDKYTSFNKWLYENDEKLFDWAASKNYYDYGTEDYNINSLSFQSLVGANDQTYSFIERYGGMTKKELDDVFKDITTVDIDSLSKDDTSEVESTLKYTSDSINKLRQITKDLGIDEDIGQQLGGWDNIIKTTSEALDKFTTQEEWDKYGWDVIKTGVLSSAAVGGSIGSFAGPAGVGIGALIGLMVGLLGTGIYAASVVDKQKEENNKKNYEIARQQSYYYNQILNTFKDYTETQRKEKQGK